MSVLAVGLGESGGGYQAQRSLRFRASASAFLSRFPVVQTSVKKWTWSGWVKRGVLGKSQGVFDAYVDGGNYTVLHFASDVLRIYNIYGGVNSSTETVALFRDTSAHLHITCVVDTDSATAADRAILYVNGIRQAHTNNYGAYTLGELTYMNSSTVQHNLGVQQSDGLFFDGYISDVHLIDGQALPPSSFGQIDPVTGQWTAKKYTGTYGTNGFYLDFKDPASLTTLMLDRSGNGNNWTAHNISLTAGATYDSMLDVPLGAGGQERGNYAVVNPLDSYTDLGLTDGNLRHVANNRRRGPSTIAMSSGKWYWEITPQGTGGGYIGISQSFRNQCAATEVGSVGYYAGEYSYSSTDGAKFSNNSLSSYGASYAENDVIGTALDLDSGTLTFYKNGVSQGVAFTGISGEYVACACAGYAQILTYVHNYGQRPFAYTPPVGFKALHTGNLTNITPIASGSFTGDLSADGPFIWCNGTPDTLTINGNSVTWGTHADKTAGGFKLRTSSSSYNSSGTNTWTATYLSPSTKSAFKYQNAKGNP